MSEPQPVPTLYEWLGGMPALLRLTATFYERVPHDPVLGPLFAQTDPEHRRHVAVFLAEVFGGPKVYSETLGGRSSMIGHHIGRAITERQRARWMQMLLECADELGVPSDPEFRSAFVAYLEWGTRIAVMNSQPGAVVVADGPMPKWGWGEAKGPFIPQ